MTRLFERFTERARQVVTFAQEEARALRHEDIGTEHLLLGLVREEEGFAARALLDRGLDEKTVREEVLKVTGKGDAAPEGQMPFTGRAKKVLEMALREALTLGHNYIGTEHILLALIRVGDGLGASILAERVDPEEIRNDVIRVLGGVRPREEDEDGGKKVRYFVVKLEQPVDDQIASLITTALSALPYVESVEAKKHGLRPPRRRA